MDFAKWISFCSVIILIYIIWQVRKILLLVFTAVVFAITLNLLVEKFCKLGLKRGYGVIIATVIFLIAIALFFCDCSTILSFSVSGIINSFTARY